MGPVQNLSDLLNLLHRRMLLIGVIVLLGCIASVMAAISRPKVYETAAVIQVEGPVVVDSSPNAGAQAAHGLQRQPVVFLQSHFFLPWVLRFQKAAPSA